MRLPILIIGFLTFCAPTAIQAADAQPAPNHDIALVETDDAIQIDTGALQAVVRKRGYVSGIAETTFFDKKTGAREIGYGLHIMDFLLAPGWRDDGYERNPMIHGNLPKHYVEGPQLCRQAKVLESEITRGKDFVAIRLRHTYTKPGEGYKAGSKWEQTLVFQPDVRFVLSCERITSINDVDDLFYRIDMPGHIRHKGEDNFAQVYLSYLPKPIPAAMFDKDFAPDAQFFYQRKAGPDKSEAVPERMIRAYQVKLNGKAGPWLAGMTLDPAEVCEAWCHERGYVCFIEELHRRHVKAGETFGAAYVIGWFDDIPAMQHTYDQFKGKHTIIVDAASFHLE